MSETYYFTPAGLLKYREEMKRVDDELVKLQASIAHVAETGGNVWHDNASYDYVTGEIRQNDKRLRDMMTILRQGIIVDKAVSNDFVAIGTKVSVLWNDKEQEWFIGGYGESDPDNGIIAYNTPLGNLIFGKKVGETSVGEIGRRKVTIIVLKIGL